MNRLLLVSALLLGLCSCGGSGGGNEDEGCSALEDCGLGDYLPNYVDNFSDGNADDDLFYWQGFRIDVYYDFSDPEFEAIADEALEAWRSQLDTLIPTCTSMFRFTNNPANAEIEFMFVTQEEIEAITGNSRSIGLTRFFFQAGTRRLTSAEIYVAVSDDGNEFSDAKKLRIAKHEIGHALGIAAHSANTTDKMYAFDSPDNSEVTDLDLNTLAYSYCVQNRSRTGAPDAPILHRDIVCP